MIRTQPKRAQTHRASLQRTQARARIACVLALAACACAGLAPAQTERPLAEIVEDYVREGLRSNLTLRNQTLEVDRAIASLDAARARFYPELSLEARYTVSDGGRVFTIPLSAFDPQLEDQTVQFLRDREQDTRLSLRQPLYAPAIPATLRARRSLLDGAEYARIAVARRLKRDITVAYLDWLRAGRTVAIVDASAVLLGENLRVNESLYRNGKLTQDQVLRAQAELLEVEQQSREARTLVSQSRSYLNFLLNRPLDTALEGSDVETVARTTALELSELRDSALANRAELSRLESVSRAADAQADAARATLKPTIGVGIDGGTQGEEYRFGEGYDFATASIQFSWKLFDGGANRAAVREARAIAKQAETQRDEVAQQIQLEVQQALDRLTTASDSLATAEARSDAARAGFRIASRKRDEGVISQVEFIDARSTLTRAEINLNLTRFALLARQAELDYATASGSLPLDLRDDEVSR